MGNYNRGDRSGGRGFERRGFNDRGRDNAVVMHSAVCGKCGKNCEVPFRPTNDRPVYCSDCFENNRNSDSGRSDRPSNFSDREMFEAVCADCGNTCKVPFRPTQGKPVFCSNCFGDKKEGPSRGREQFKSEPQNNEQLKELNNKLDKILAILNPKVSEEPSKVQEEITEVPALEVEMKPKTVKKKPSKKKSDTV